jgi:hypothetical protein
MNRLINHYLILHGNKYEESGLWYTFAASVRKPFCPGWASSIPERVITPAKPSGSFFRETWELGEKWQLYP